MMNNVFEIVQIMLNYAFFLIEDDDNDDDSMEQDEEIDVESIKDEGKIPMLKSLGRYGSMAAFDADAEDESQKAWHTFQEMSDALVRLPRGEISQHLQAHPMILVPYSISISNTLNECISSIRPYYGNEEGVAALNSLIATVDSVKSCLVKGMCEKFVQSNHLLNSSVSVTS